MIKSNFFLFVFHTNLFERDDPKNVTLSEELPPSSLLFSIEAGLLSGSLLLPMLLVLDDAGGEFVSSDSSDE